MRTGRSGRPGAGGHRRGRLATVLATVGTVVAGPVPAAHAGAGAPGATGPYQLTLRASAVENYAEVYRELVQGLGFSRVTLTREAGARQGRSEAEAAGAWLVTDDEPCLLGCRPPCPDPGVIANPTVAHASFPDTCGSRSPSLTALGVPAEVAADLPSPAWPQSAAETRTDAAGSAAGRNVHYSTFPGVGIGAAESTGGATVSRETGEYTGTARSFIGDIGSASGTLRSVTSLMRVTAVPGAQPRVTYLLSVGGVSGGGSTTEVDEVGFTLAGYDVPAGDLEAQFNSRLAEAAAAVGMLGQLGVGLLAPQVGQSADGRRYRIAAPVLVLGLDADALKNTAAGDSGVRLASAVFEGSFAAPDPPLR